MATYKYPKYLQQDDSPSFDGEHAPGSATPFSGIYRCLGCAKEITSEGGNPLPPQNHHQHNQKQGKIRWRLIVWANHNARENL